MVLDNHVCYHKLVALDLRYDLLKWLASGDKLNLITFNGIGGTDMVSQVEPFTCNC